MTETTLPQYTGDGPIVRVRNDRTGYYFWVSQDQGQTWTPLMESRLAEHVRSAKSNWAADHPLPDPHLSDVPTGEYYLRDVDQGLTLERIS
jgi:hypothetical protein